MIGKFERFGKYILLEKLASGGMAEVFLARSSGAGGVGKFVAIKRILPQYSDSEEFINMFKSEAKVAVNLAHSNIVSIYEFGVQNQQFFLVMDYIEGRNLRQFLNRMKKEAASFSVDQIVYIIKEVASGLDHAHRCHDGTTGKPLNIIHRDISPQNVMVSFEGEIKVVDFGIAKSESMMESTKAGTLKGKFGYMSPEQADGQPLDLRTDIFSLGIVLWEMLANDRLFVSNNEVNTLRKIRECVVPSLRKINPAVPLELEQIVRKALAKDRSERYQTCADLHKDLNRFLNRQFPDFTPQEFSKFTKGLFADEIVETRKRLIVYAQELSQPTFENPVISPPPLSPAPRPRHEGAGSEISDIPPPPSALMGEESADSPKLLGINPAEVTSHKVDLGKLKLPPSSSKPKGKGGISEGTSPQITIERRYESSIPFGPVLLAVAALGGVFWLSQNPQTQKSLLAQIARLQNPGPKEPAPAPLIPQGPQQVAILVLSEPTGAEILLDGVSTGMITPATLQVEASRPVKVEARMKGFEVAATQIESPQNGHRLSLDLIKQKTGYVRVQTPKGDFEISVDGEVIPAGSGNLEKLPVPAAKPVVIKAKNLANGATEELEVIVAEEQIQSLALNPRLPDQRKSPAAQTRRIK